MSNEITISASVAKKIGYHPIESAIKKFMGYSLYEITKTNSKTKFLQNPTKFCYQLTYSTTSFSFAGARDDYCGQLKSSTNDYIKQQMHSMSGENKDLCYYTYSPDNLREFLENNKDLHYTFFPITVHATDSANGIRHDMLLIFDNKTKLVYWFDGKNTEGYLQLGSKLSNTIDTLFIQMFDSLKLGYNYEPSPSWQIQSVLVPYPSVGSIDFVFSTAWCYNMLLALEDYDSPTSYLSVLDAMGSANTFHMLYTSMLNMINASIYHESVPLNARLDFVAETLQHSNISDYPENKTVGDIYIATKDTAVKGQPVYHKYNNMQEMQSISHLDLTKISSSDSDSKELLTSKSTDSEKFTLLDSTPVRDKHYKSPDSVRRRRLHSDTIPFSNKVSNLKPMPVVSSYEINKSDRLNKPDEKCIIS
jgi:hypothetical protein